jgi:Na+-transporting NADH:ubiquinone oxidoreductase subunit C
VAANKDSIGNTLRVALLLCLVCAVLVSTAAVTLRPAQEHNRALFREVNILRTAGLSGPPGADLHEARARLERRFVDLANGDYVDRPDAFDPLAAARDPEQSQALVEDPAGIRRIAHVGEVFLVRDADGRLSRIVLPVRGYGLWSTMHGFVALERDLTTVAGIRFYEHAETPGLGGEIDNPRWQARWVGKRVFDDAGALALRVNRGAVPEGAADAVHRVDGLAGATITARGVENLIRFWLGQAGYGPYLARLGERLAAGQHQ